MYVWPSPQAHLLLKPETGQATRRAPVCSRSGEAQSEQSPDKWCSVTSRQNHNHSLLQPPLLDQAHLDPTTTPEDNLRPEHGTTPMLQAILSLEMNANVVWKHPPLIFSRKNLEGHVSPSQPIKYLFLHWKTLSSMVSSYFQKPIPQTHSLF